MLSAPSNRSWPTKEAATTTHRGWLLFGNLKRVETSRMYIR